MTTYLQSTKAWLSPDGEPIWVSSHIQGACDILKRSFSGCGFEAYQIMFDAEYVRIQIDRHDLFFNFSGKEPNDLQMRWLRETAFERHLILVNGDRREGVALE